MRRPFMGAPVLTLGFRSNGALEHPAIITRVWTEEDRVNITIFPDNAIKPESYTSVRFVQTRAEAERARQLGGPFDIVAFWNDAESEPELIASEPTAPVMHGAMVVPRDVTIVELADSKFTMTPQEVKKIDPSVILKRAAELEAEGTVV